MSGGSLVSGSYCPYCCGQNHYPYEKIAAPRTMHGIVGALPCLLQKVWYNQFTDQLPSVLRLSVRFQTSSSVKATPAFWLTWPMPILSRKPCFVVRRVEAPSFSAVKRDMRRLALCLIVLLTKAAHRLTYLASLSSSLLSIAQPFQTDFRPSKQADWVDACSRIFNIRGIFIHPNPKKLFP